MSTDLSNPVTHRPGDNEIAALVRAFLGGQADAENRLTSLLLHHAQITVRDFLRHAGPETDDLAQETAVSVLAYLRRKKAFEGSLINFTIAVARNRCRNHLVWLQRQRLDSLDETPRELPDQAPGPLESLVEKEKYALLQAAVDALDDRCRDLLHAIYHENRSFEDLRREAGLGSVQSIYARRAGCLAKVEMFLKNRLFHCSSEDKDNDGYVGGDRVGSRDD